LIMEGRGEKFMTVFTGIKNVESKTGLEEFIFTGGGRKQAKGSLLSPSGLRKKDANAL